MRVSDVERQRVVEELRRHCAAGRLGVDEYADRIEQALVATTLQELDRILGDLPMLRIADPVAPSRGLGRGRSRVAGELATGDGAGPAPGRMASAVIVVLTLAVVLLAGLGLTVLSWGWAAVTLLLGWLVGLGQATVARRRH